jgi:hypothetical protein
VLEPLAGIEIAQKTVKHSPTQKLLDALMGFPSACLAFYEINCRVRPDLPPKEPSEEIAAPQMLFLRRTRRHWQKGTAISRSSK